MMRLIFIIILFAQGVCLMSCSKWLDINPENQIGKDQLFEDEMGFQNALNGIYQKCSETSLYGKNLSWGALSLMAQNYRQEFIRDLTDQYFGKYEYESAEVLQAIDGIWSGMYNVIANCNLLLKEIASKPASMFMLDTVAKNLIEGEAYALRAMAHFDLIRLFASAPNKNADMAVVPYHDTYPSEVTLPLKTKDAIDRVIKDLLHAKDLVAYHDTSYNKEAFLHGASGRFGKSEGIKGGDFFKKRGYRLNYCAIVGMLSRVYMYKGDVDQALFYAQYFYDRFYKNNAWFFFNTPEDYTTSLIYKQKKYLEECIFAFYNRDLLQNVESYCAGDNGSDLLLADYDGIFYDDTDDYRASLLSDSDEHFIYKYRDVNSSLRNEFEGYTIPVLRISEIFYILIEGHYLKGNVTQALELLKELRMKKGAKRQISSIESLDHLYDILVNDARREFIGEGQLFFMYKRLNRDILIENGSIAAMEERMTFKVPDSQNFY